MTITTQITARGKAIHRLSLEDLIDAVECGGRLRAYCPIHGGDHQRSLSIDRASGWGFCHCCHAVVLVESLNPLHTVSSTGSFTPRKNTGAAFPFTTSSQLLVGQLAMAWP
jgi:hypothetical protein